ncbi:MAG: type II and III secretion system protein, partial [Rhodospirillales bacterium]|nr:type II and III secretion system protein [Acetobacter sp.]
MIRFRPLSPRLQAAAIGALLPCLAPALHAQTRTTTTTTTRRTTTTRSLESTAQTEVARRQSLVVSADDNIRQGDAAMIREDYEDAVRLYRTATDSLTDSPATGDRRRRALNKFVEASLKLAELRIVEARYPDAEAVAKVVLRPEYDPNNEDALELLQHLEDPEYYNQTITPKHVQKVQRVKDLLRAGNQYYDTGRYDLSFKKFEEVLALDPYNDAARRGEERIDLAKSKHAENTGYPETRGRLLAQVNTGWELPIRRNTADIDPRRNVQKLNDSSGTVAITRKLQSIVIPNIEFRQTTLNDAVEFLRQEARRLDTGAPEDERGVNIFLKLASGSPRTAVVAPTTDAASIPGLPTGAESTPTAPVAPPAVSATGTTRISLTLSRIPLLAALDYVAKAANLKIKVEPYAVSIVPLTEETGDLITLEVR